MKNRRYLQIGAPFLALLVTITLTPGLHAQHADESPDIQITEVPPASPGNPNIVYPISGKVTGAPNDVKVVIYAFAADKWWVQPFDYAPLTEVNAGKFETETHPGSIYAALLVKSSYKPAASLQALPDKGGDVLARHRVAGKQN